MVKSLDFGVREIWIQFSQLYIYQQGGLGQVT